MKTQCDEHDCSELLCGCATVLLEDDSYFNEAIVAKDKWIEKLLKENCDLRCEITCLKGTLKDKL